MNNYSILQLMCAAFEYELKNNIEIKISESAYEDKDYFDLCAIKGYLERRISEIKSATDGP
jgi:hypothetical protein